MLEAENESNNRGRENVSRNQKRWDMSDYKGEKSCQKSPNTGKLRSSNMRSADQNYLGGEL